MLQNLIQGPSKAKPTMHTIFMVRDDLTKGYRLVSKYDTASVSRNLWTYQCALFLQ